MDLGVDGRVALVTGSSRDVGRAVAEQLAAEGCRVVVHGRDVAAVESVVAGIRDRGGAAERLLGDLGDPDDLARVGRAARQGGVDVLVNNAGPFVEHDWDDVEAQHWLDAVSHNVVTAAALTKAVLPGMRSRGWGRIITVGSRAATTALPNMVEYSAAKAAVVNMTVSLARHLAGSGITANCVSPGVVLTPSLRAMFGDRWQEAAVTADYAPNPVGRLARPEDVAAAVAYLAGEPAGYVTGVNLKVDGGITGVA